ncbi:lycopene cyclase domain-containing protein [Putridiphycobacter roseus]|uniref:Lycopene cyclase domain-containing protein n=1 Tax=Putridiphycobacter roseus TaxID=2219161 RepID=A0A2W1NGA4_9FLAO|nr:lycopene cyclase domain-containing protein [Putridiphycobacter roseus]PZE17066.1 lycopene cyclase domain-containing protein [Putridiphycobacter roseus]
MKLYLSLVCVTLLFPLILSWDKKVQFYKQFKALFLSIVLVGLPFVIWDIWFTEMGVWGFTPEHLLGIYIFNLPLEEILFFVFVPYACVFIHDTINAYWPIKTSTHQIRWWSMAWIFGSVLLAIVFYDHYYSVLACSLSAIVGFLLWKQNTNYQKSLWRTFFIVMVPFIVINGALTGWFTDNPVVWYNDIHNFGLRLGTIPYDDIIYNFSLIIGVIMLRDRLQKSKKS